MTDRGNTLEGKSYDEFVADLNAIAQGDPPYIDKLGMSERMNIEDKGRMMIGIVGVLDRMEMQQGKLLTRGALQRITKDVVTDYVKAPEAVDNPDFSRRDDRDRIAEEVDREVMRRFDAALQFQNGLDKLLDAYVKTIPAQIQEELQGKKPEEIARDYLGNRAFHQDNADKLSVPGSRMGESIMQGQINALQEAMAWEMLQKDEYTKDEGYNIEKGKGDKERINAALKTLRDGKVQTLLASTAKTLGCESILSRQPSMSAIG